MLLRFLHRYCPPTSLVLALSVSVLCCSTPSDGTVRSEFHNRYPNSEIVNIELIFEQDAVAVYLIKARQKGQSEELTYDFALKRSMGTWQGCDDRTERNCK